MVLIGPLCPIREHPLTLEQVRITDLLLPRRAVIAACTVVYIPEAAITASWTTMSSSNETWMGFSPRTATAKAAMSST